MKANECKWQSFLDQAVLNAGQVIFYLIKYWNKEGSFYKLGITANNILTRYYSSLYAELIQNQTTRQIESIEIG